MMERSALHNAEMALAEARMKVMQAQHMAPDANIRDLPQADIAEQSLLGDVIFDNIWSDMKMHDKIEASARQVGACHKAALQQLEAARARHRSLTADAEEKHRLLEVSRQALQGAREAAFARITGGGQAPASQGGDDGPPAYAPPAYSA
jgi:hypothetical protein